MFPDRGRARRKDPGVGVTDKGGQSWLQVILSNGISDFTEIIFRGNHFSAYVSCGP